MRNVKGTRDYLPQDEMLKRKVKQTLEETFRRYGCKPMETPILNETELLASKYAGGDEILEEMYRLTDRGERDLALRYDLTIPFAKVIAMNPTLPMPLKRYEIGKVFRDGPIKTGRLREFTQCDVDIAGVESVIAEAELMAMAVDAFEKLGLSVTVVYNNRKVLTGVLEACGIGKEKMTTVIQTIDKLEKLGSGNVRNELKRKGIEEEVITRIFTTLEQGIGEYNGEGTGELRDLKEYLDYLGVADNCRFELSLARGLDIYTGTVYEIFLNEGAIASSIGSGGRYDNAVAGLVGTEDAFPTVGISFGLDVIFAAMENQAEQKSDIDYWIVPMNQEKEALKVAQQLRQEGNNVEVDFSGRKIGKAMKRADKEGAQYVIVVGEEEVESRMVQVKNMRDGETIEKKI
ncbi:histidine--tRNA ligase [Salimicrobium halophilum]|uniref:Histidine--tRNA ligase n=1 Tax=Salimicrobium halophilum TaxID=86666 RepID=A0A1G8UT69_9BACI|nr:histidine--tRNA ligase [Salimicrobium halophilum]SDJ57076.1 histidyl-tRNA synthetase [Salimicrobium halophilum]